MYHTKKEVLEKQMTLERQSAKQPSWNLGYFSQSLENNFLFQGLSVGVQVPLDKRSSKAKTQQLAIDQDRMDNLKALQLQQFESEVDAIRSKLDFLQASIDTYQQNTQPSQSVILDKASKQYEQGEIDFLRFSQKRKREKSETEDDAKMFHK